MVLIFEIREDVVHERLCKFMVLKIEANRNLSFLFTLRFCDFDLFKATTFFTEDNFMY